MCIPNLKKNIIQKLLSSFFTNNNRYITAMHFRSKYVVNAILHYVKIYTDDTQEFHLKIESTLTENAG